MWSPEGRCSKISNTCCQINRQPKQCRPRSWLLLKKQSDQGLPCVLFWVNSSLDNQHFIWEQKDLFVLILYLLLNNCSVMSGWVFLCWTSTKQRIKYLAQGQNTVPSVRLEPATLQVSYQALYHWAIALLKKKKREKILQNIYSRCFKSSIY